MILTPLPGTPVFEQMENEGRLLSRDWGYYDAHHVVFEPKKMNSWQLQKLTISAMTKFYSFRQILNRLNRFDLWTMAVRAYGWRLTRKSRKNMRYFTNNLKMHYKNAGKSIGSAGHDLHIRARRDRRRSQRFFPFHKSGRHTSREGRAHTQMACFDRKQRTLTSQPKTGDNLRAL